MHLGIIENIARIIICGVLPLAVFVSALALVCKSDKKCRLDTEQIEQEWKAVIGYGFAIVLLWLMSLLIMHNYIYTAVTNTIQSLINDETNLILQWIIKIVPLAVVLLYVACNLFLKITIYPDLAFRVVPGQIKRLKNKKFYQFETQFWNAGILPHYNMKIKLTKYIRNKQGNIESQNVAMPSIDDWNIKNILFSQDERACNVSSCPDKWEYNGTPPIFEYLEVTVSSEARLFNTKKSIELSETKKFYPLDIHQGDFMDINDKKNVPQPLVTSYNEHIFVSAKRKIQKWDEALRFTQCVLLILYVILLITSACISTPCICEILVLSHRITLALILVLAIGRIVLSIPIKATITPSYIYGLQQ